MRLLRAPQLDLGERRVGGDEGHDGQDSDVHLPGVLQVNDNLKKVLPRLHEVASPARGGIMQPRNSRFEVLCTCLVYPFPTTLMLKTQQLS